MFIIVFTTIRAYPVQKYSTKSVVSILKSAIIIKYCTVTMVCKGSKAYNIWGFSSNIST